MASADCDDGDVGSAPGLPEIRCDGRDNDCVGGDDRTGCEVSPDQVTWTFPGEAGCTATSVKGLGDLDGDDGEELAIAWTSEDGSEFTTVVSGIAVGAPRALRFEGAEMVWPAGDVDGDGQPDLWVGYPPVVTDPDPVQQLRLAPGPLPADGNGTVEEIGFDGGLWSTTYNPRSLDTADVDGDGLSDLVTGGGACLAPFTGIADAASCSGFAADIVQVVDWDRDGIAEVLVSIPRDGFGTWPAVAVLPLVAGPLDFTADYEQGLPRFEDPGALADFDGDGETDALLGNLLFAPASAVDYGGADFDPAAFSTSRPDLGGAAPGFVADVDGDGAVEVLTLDLNTLTFVVARILPGRSVPAELAGWNFSFLTMANDRGALADLDGDGQADVVFVTPQGGEAFAGAAL